MIPSHSGSHMNRSIGSDGIEVRTLSSSLCCAAEEADLRSLPFDLLQAGRRLPTLRLAEIFPKLSNPVIQALDRSRLDPLHEAYASYDGGELGDRSTRSFVLRSVFGCVPELVKTSGDLLRLLCESNLKDPRFPTLLDDHVVQVLRARHKLCGLAVGKDRR